MTTLFEPAYAKVNLTLDVLGKRDDGYHELQSIMQGISLRDDIEIDVGTGKPWKLLCSLAKWSQVEEDSQSVTTGTVKLKPEYI